MKANDDRCNLILSSSEEDAAIKTEESSIKCLKVKKLYMEYMVKDHRQR